MRFKLKGFFITLVCLANLSFAQDFFPPDYAKSPIEINAGSIENNSVPSSSSSASSKSVDSIASNSDAPVTAQNESQKSESIVEGEGAGEAILSLSLIVDGLSDDQLKHGYQTLLDLYNKKKVQPGSIMIIGHRTGQSADVQDLSKRLAMIGGSLDILQEVPKNFKVTLSPTWIVTLASGDLILEGLKSPDKLINTRGELMRDRISDSDKASGEASEF